MTKGTLSRPNLLTVRLIIVSLLCCCHTPLVYYRCLLFDKICKIHLLTNGHLTQCIVKLSNHFPQELVDGLTREVKQLTTQLNNIQQQLPSLQEQYSNK